MFRFLFSVVLLTTSLFGQAEAPCRLLDNPNDSTPVSRPWVDGIVPIRFESNVTASNQKLFWAAIAELQKYASVHFVPWTGQNDYVSVLHSPNSNASYLGRIGGGQRIWIYNWNMKFIMVHELMHALGIDHEQNRPDQKQHVKIETANIIPSAIHNFTVRGDAKGWGPHDFDSLMYYGQYAFSSNNKRTIIVLAPNQSWQGKIGQRTHMSVGDIDGVRSMYGAVKTARVSVSSTKGQGNGDSEGASISADGRFVAFFSASNNLVSGDTNGKHDVFVHDRQTGATTRISLSSKGVQGNSGSYSPAISGNGRFVAFASDATNLVSLDLNGKADVFVHDRQTKVTVMVSVDSKGGQGNSHSYEPSISADGMAIAFFSTSKNLVLGDVNSKMDVFVHDIVSHKTSLVSVSSKGGQGNGDSEDVSISADGRFVAFDSDATNLVVGDTNKSWDVFVHDRVTKVTKRVSVSSKGGQGNGDSWIPRISADGRFVALGSSATNLVSGDTNKTWDLFLKNIKTGSISAVTDISDSCNPGFDVSSISADGRFVSYSLGAHIHPCIVPLELMDARIYDSQTKSSERLNISSSGTIGLKAGDSYTPSISANGLYVAFTSGASNLVPGDTNGKYDIFVRERLSFQPGVSNYGVGCSGSLGIPLMHARSRARNEGNNSFEITLTGGRRSSAALFIISLNQANFPLGGGCSLYLDPLYLFPVMVFATDSAGMARMPFPIPTNAKFKGIKLYTQGLILDSLGGWLGFSVTNGLTFTIQ